MLQSVTASQQCVSTRCDLWFGGGRDLALLCPCIHDRYLSNRAGSSTVQSSLCPCEKEHVGGECLYYWRILCDVINCGAVTTIWYCDQRNPWHCSRVGLPPGLRYQWLALIQQAAWLFLQQPDWRHNGGCLPSSLPHHPQLELGTVQ